MTTAAPHGKPAITRLVGCMARWLVYAAAPTFAVMALLTASATPMLCSATTRFLPLDGMATMYLLMSLFHLRPWLKLAGAAWTAPNPPTRGERS